MMKEIIVEEDLDKLALESYQYLEEHVTRLSKEQDCVVLAIPGGRSVLPLFKLLSSHKNFPWEKIQLFIIDERLVPTNSPMSNFHEINNSFLKDLLHKKYISQEQIHSFEPNLDVPDAGISSYNDELKKYGGIFDIVILGVGEDGHVGGIFPRSFQLNTQESIYVVFHDSPKPPLNRMSATKKLLTTAKVAITFFIGQGKKSALKNYLDDGVSLDDCPVKIINEIPIICVFTNIKFDMEGE